MEYRVYKVFINEVQEPFKYARTLSNGDLIGYLDIEGIEAPEDSLTQEEVLEYIKQNHVEEEDI